MSGALKGIYEPGVVDPGIPVPNPTNTFWHLNPHPRGNHQSPWPQDVVDVVIIGSGISGMNLARTLLGKDPNLSVILVEARTLCSGATGRNGGHIKTMTFAMWEERKRSFGVEEAIRISAFEHSHLEAMKSAIQNENIDCDLVLTEGVDAYYEEASFKKAVQALEDMRAHAPHLAAKHAVYTDKDQLRQKFKLSTQCIGAVGVPAASVWPYKWVTTVLGRLMDQDLLNVQTHTTVRDIVDRDSDNYATVVTDRGQIKARNVVHATNAWLGHLVPELRPFVSPVRGNVVHYGEVKRNSASTESAERSPLGLDSAFSLWLQYSDKDYDYLIQRKTGDIVLGRANAGRKTTADDSMMDPSPLAHLRGFGAEVMANPLPEASTHITHAWSGILAFSQDAVPFAGRLPFAGRTHQWVCGAYHATGMIKAFRTSEMVAEMILGADYKKTFPQSFLVTDRRIKALKESLDTGDEPVFIESNEVFV